MPYELQVILLSPPHPRLFLYKPLQVMHLLNK
jgi:hypothetical protein